MPSKLVCQDCCSARGDFECDDAWDRRTFQSLIQGRGRFRQPLTSRLPGSRGKQSQPPNQTSCKLQESARRRRRAPGSTRVPWS